MSAPTTLLDLAQELWLGWLLLPRKDSPTLAEAKKVLQPILSDRLTEDDWRTIVESARANELVTAERAKGAKSDRFALTAVGRKGIAAAWQVKEISTRTKWSTMITRYVTPRLLGLSAKDCSKSESLLCSLVRREYGLAPNLTTSTSVLAALALAKLNSPIAAKMRVAPKTNIVVLTALQQYVDQASEIGQTSETATRSVVDHFVPDPEFAEQVRAAVDDVPRGDGGWFGDRKVFISRVYDALHRRPEFSTLKLDEFKERLIAATQGSLLELARADVAEKMNPEDVAASSTKHFSSEFHFICVR